MEIEIDYTKSSQKNAEQYFDEAKELEAKSKGAEKTIARLNEEIEELEKAKIIEKKLVQNRKTEWYEKFYWFFTSNGMLAIGGRSAQQNEEIVSKYFEPKDMFFHADVFGASAVILKKGIEALGTVKAEVAQFAACYSKAWESGQASVDVFAAKQEQVSKSSSKGALGTGGFLIRGDRLWFRHMNLELYAFSSAQEINLQGNIEDNAIINPLPVKIEVNANKISIIPKLTFANANISNAIKLTPGDKKKSDTAKLLSEKLGFEDVDYIMQHLPPGGFSVAFR